MGKPFTIQENDDDRLKALQIPLGAKTKVEVLRRALDSLEENINKQKRISQWERGVKLVLKQSSRVNKEFQKHSLLKKVK